MIKKMLIILILSVIALSGIVLFYLSTLPDVSKLIKNNPKSTTYIKNNYPKSFNPKIIWVKNKNIPKFLKDCIRIAEDGSFYTHKGYNLEEIKNSLSSHFKKGKKLRGASTITQQLAKNLFLSKERTFSRKIKELFITIELEKKLSKKRIFEIYLNTIEFGKGIFGIQNAANYYYKKSVQNLSKEECLRLTGVISAPTKFSPYCNSRRFKFKIKWLLDTLYKFTYITDDEYQKIKKGISRVR